MDNPYQREGKWYFFDETEQEHGPYETKKQAEWELDWYVFTCLGTRNSAITLDFLKYAMTHPDERFWQALRNWSRYIFVAVSNNDAQYQDTFYWEGKRHDDV